MEDREHILELYETYKELLTERERNYFEYYYFEDYSLQEIADVYEVSKSYVGKYINKITSSLNNYELSLKLNDKNKKIKELINKIDDLDIRNQIEELL